mmetsp:Transcript_31063/g.71809  ORF Transcript_31063/g.71809 Transcript_31063/m.71809 type:complete len:215 (-) Transcript_31063:45-689(-)
MPGLKLLEGRHHIFIANQPVIRKTGYYTLNVVPLNFAVSMFSWCAYLLPLDDFESKIEIILTLLLTLTAFKMNWTLGLFVLQAMGHAVAYIRLGAGHQKYDIYQLEMMVLLILVAGLVSVHVAVVVMTKEHHKVKEMGHDELKQLLTERSKAEKSKAGKTKGSELFEETDDTSVQSEEDRLEEEEELDAMDEANMDQASSVGGQTPEADAGQAY